MGKAVISATDAIQDLLDVKSYLHERFGVACRISSGMNCGDGATPYEPNVLRLIQVGDKQLHEPLCYLSKQIATKNYVKSLVALFHEFAHVLQFRKLDAGCLDSLQVIADAVVAATGSDLYYKRNNSVLPHEVAAEWQGVLFAFDHIANRFGDERSANELIGDYLRSLSSNVQYQVHVGHDFVCTRDNIDRIFAEAYERSLVIERKLPVPLNNYERSTRFGELERRLCHEGSVEYYAFGRARGTGQDAYVAELVWNEQSPRYERLIPDYVPLSGRGSSVVKQESKRLMIEEWKYIDVGALDEVDSVSFGRG